MSQFADTSFRYKPNHEVVSSCRHVCSQVFISMSNSALIYWQRVNQQRDGEAWRRRQKVVTAFLQKFLGTKYSPPKADFLFLVFENLCACLVTRCHGSVSQEVHCWLLVVAHPLTVWVRCFMYLFILFVRSFRVQIAAVILGFFTVS